MASLISNIPISNFTSVDQYQTFHHSLTSQILGCLQLWGWLQAQILTEYFFHWYSIPFLVHISINYCCLFVNSFQFVISGFTKWIYTDSLSSKKRKECYSIIYQWFTNYNYLFMTVTFSRKKMREQCMCQVNILLWFPFATE